MKTGKRERKPTAKFIDVDWSDFGGSDQKGDEALPWSEQAAKMYVQTSRRREENKKLQMVLSPFVAICLLVGLVQCSGEDRDDPALRDAKVEAYRDRNMPEWRAQTAMDELEFHRQNVRGCVSGARDKNGMPLCDVPDQ